MQGKPSASNALAPSRSLANANFSIILSADRVTGKRSAAVTPGCLSVQLAKTSAASIRA
jgi:hypothetical protein